jgi:eukaryotic-like serine/threonine-protein kinase
MVSDQGRLVAGRYRLAEPIGRGGMGTVWRAEDELLDRQVAVKKLRVPPQLHDDERERLYERTRREARSAARIAHPNVVVVHDVVEDEGLPCVVMEYVPSRTLSDVLKKDGPITAREAARIGRGMVAALRAAHKAGVLHRDVKPANVLLGLDDSAADGSWPGGRVVLTDFGIATVTGTSTLTRTGELIGSFDYLAPERITGGNPGPASDLWALGATLYQAVEGVAPFHRDTPIETAYAIASEPVAPPRHAGPLAPVIQSLLAKEPERRMSAEQVERLLVSSVETVAAHGLGADGENGAHASATAATRPHSTPSWAVRDADPDAAEVLADPGPEAPDSQQGHDNLRHGAPDSQHNHDNLGHGAPENPAHPDHFENPPRDPAPQRPISQHPAAQHPVPQHPAPQAVERPRSDSGLTAPTAIALSGLAVGESGARGHGDVGDGGGQSDRHRGRGVIIAAVLVLLIAVVVVSGILARHFGMLAGPGGGGGTPSAKTSTGEPTPTTSTPPPEPTWPAGYHLVNDAAGFKMAVPDGWTRLPEPKKNEIDYISPDGLSGLKVSIEDFAPPSPLQHWKDLEKVLEGDDQNYSLLRMNATTTRVGGVLEKAAIWEWTWQGQARVFHALDLGFGKEGGTGYAVYLSAPDAQWQNQKAAFYVAVQTFRPTT